MKLYTEEEVIQMILSSYLYGVERAHDYKDVKEHILKSVTPIELPSDEEIEKYFTHDLIFGVYKVDYNKVEGAKWMRNKIQRGNNEQQ